MQVVKQFGFKCIAASSQLKGGFGKGQFTGEKWEGRVLA